MVWAGLLLLVMGPVDAMDGAMARLRNEASAWGAFVDAVTDRYSELFLFLGYLIYFMVHPSVAGLLLAYLAAAGSVLTSYVKARADASEAGRECRRVDTGRTLHCSHPGFDL